MGTKKKKQVRASHVPKQVNAPAVIIAPEHQSAPKTQPAANRPVISEMESRPNLNAPQGGGAWFDDYDRELDGGPCTVSTDPRANAQMAELYERSLHEERLDPAEEAVKQREKSTLAMRDYRWGGQERWQGRQNEEMRMVRIMHPHQFIYRLRRIGVAASVDDPYEQYRADNMPTFRWPKWEAALWLNSFTARGMVGVTAWVEGEPKTITTLQYPFGPEWSIVRFNEYNVPTNEKYRGWRSALLAIIVAGIITEEQAHRAFGEPRGTASLYYREQLYKYRSVKYGIVSDREEDTDD